MYLELAMLDLPGTIPFVHDGGIWFRDDGFVITTLFRGVCENIIRKACVNRRCTGLHSGKYV